MRGDSECSVEHVFFIDEDSCGRAAAEALRKSGESVELLRDHFLPSTPDPEWIREVAKRGWSIITRDSRMRWVPPERRAIESSNAKYFVLRGKQLSGVQMRNALLKARHRIKAIAQSRKGYLFAKIYASGRVRITDEGHWDRGKKAPG